MKLFLIKIAAKVWRRDFNSPNSPSSEICAFMVLWFYLCELVWEKLASGVFMYTPILASGDSGEEASEMILNVLEECFANEENKSSAEVKFEL